jgi:hypothetical protein
LHGIEAYVLVNASLVWNQFVYVYVYVNDNQLLTTSPTSSKYTVIRSMLSAIPVSKLFSPVRCAVIGVNATARKVSVWRGGIRYVKKKRIQKLAEYILSNDLLIIFLDIFTSCCIFMTIQVTRHVYKGEGSLGFKPLPPRNYFCIRTCQ